MARTRPRRPTGRPPTTRAAIELVLREARGGWVGTGRLAELLFGEDTEANRAALWAAIARMRRAGLVVEHRWRAGYRLPQEAEQP